MNQLSIVWISCTTGSSSAELLQECQRSYAVAICLPSRAMATLANSRPTVVIFDFGDPLAADLHLLQSVKRNHASLPILMLTDTHSADLAVWAMRARVWNYLVKPVPLRELKTNLKQLASFPARHASGAREIMRPATVMPVPYANPDPHGDRGVLEHIVDDVRRDCSSLPSVTELARSCGISRFAFSRLFRATFGISYRDYVMRQRLEQACKMLELPEHSVTSAAIAAGFEDTSYFARVFRRHMRKSPREYARAARSQRPKAHALAFGSMNQ